MAKKKNKFLRRLPLAGIFLLLMLGIAFFMYPIVGNWYNQYTSDALIKAYDSMVQDVGNETIEIMEAEAVEYNTALAENETDKLSVFRYDDLLNVRDSLGYIEIPKIEVSVPIFHGLSDDVLKKGIGHMEGTSLPVGGESTHCVLAGHTGLPSSKLFTDLDLLAKGDVFYIHVLNKVLKYRVDQIKVVLPYEMDDIKMVEGRDYVTLLTCTPYGINDHRLLVRGVRVEEETETPENTSPWPSVHKTETKVPARTILWYAAVAVIGFVLLMIIVILIFPSIRKRKKKRAKPKQTSEENIKP